MSYDCSDDFQNELKNHAAGTWVFCVDEDITMEQLADKGNISIDALIAANPELTDRPRDEFVPSSSYYFMPPGNGIVIVEDAPSEAEPIVDEVNNQTQTEEDTTTSATYSERVYPPALGETWEDISAKTGVPVEILKALNPTIDDQIPTNRIKIPVFSLNIRWHIEPVVGIPNVTPQDTSQWEGYDQIRGTPIDNYITGYDNGQYIIYIDGQGYQGVSYEELVQMQVPDATSRGSVYHPTIPTDFAPLDLTGAPTGELERDPNYALRLLYYYKYDGDLNASIDEIHRALAQDFATGIGDLAYYNKDLVSELGEDIPPEEITATLMSAYEAGEISLEWLAQIGAVTSVSAYDELGMNGFIVDPNTGEILHTLSGNEWWRGSEEGVEVYSLEDPINMKLPVFGEIEIPSPEPTTFRGQYTLSISDEQREALVPQQVALNTAGELLLNMNYYLQGAAIDSAFEPYYNREFNIEGLRIEELESLLPLMPDGEVRGGDAGKVKAAFSALVGGLHTYMNNVTSELNTLENAENAYEDQLKENPLDDIIMTLAPIWSMAGAYYFPAFSAWFSGAEAVVTGDPLAYGGAIGDVLSPARNASKASHIDDLDPHTPVGRFLDNRFSVVNPNKVDVGNVRIRQNGDGNLIIGAGGDIDSNNVNTGGSASNPIDAHYQQDTLKLTDDMGRQEWGMSCVPATYAQAFRDCGIEVTESEIRDMMDTHPVGGTALVTVERRGVMQEFIEEDPRFLDNQVNLIEIPAMAEDLKDPQGWLSGALEANDVVMVEIRGSVRGRHFVIVDSVNINVDSVTVTIRDPFPTIGNVDTIGPGLTGSGMTGEITWDIFHEHWKKIGYPTSLMRTIE